MHCTCTCTKKCSLHITCTCTSKRVKKRAYVQVLQPLYFCKHKSSLYMLVCDHFLGHFWIFLHLSFCIGVFFLLLVTWVHTHVSFIFTNVTTGFNVESLSSKIQWDSWSLIIQFKKNKIKQQHPTSRFVWNRLLWSDHNCFAYLQADWILEQL